MKKINYIFLPTPKNIDRISSLKNLTPNEIFQVQDLKDC